MDDLIESLGASDTSAGTDKQPSAETGEASETVYEKHPDIKHDAVTEGEEMKELRPEECDGEATVEECDGEAGEEEGGWEHSELIPSLEGSCEKNAEGSESEQLSSGLRRRNRPE